MNTVISITVLVLILGFVTGMLALWILTQRAHERRMRRMREMAERNDIQGLLNRDWEK